MLRKRWLPIIEGKAGSVDPDPQILVSEAAWQAALPRVPGFANQKRGAGLGPLLQKMLIKCGLPLDTIPSCPHRCQLSTLFDLDSFSRRR